MSTWKMTLEIIAIVGGIATLLALLLAPMFFLGAKIDKLRDDMYQEMKDFHNRLFILEERNRK
jgi:hypothetical protein